MNTDKKSVHLILHDKSIREERKQRYLLNICIYAHVFIINKEKILMTITALFLVPGHVVLADIVYKYLLLPPLLDSLCLQPAPQLVMVIFLKGLGHS